VGCTLIQDNFNSLSGGIARDFTLDRTNTSQRIAPIVKLTTVLLLAFVVAVALVVIKRLGLLSGRASGVWPFYVKRPLSQPEQVLYHRLIRALPDHIVLAQVQVSRVLGVKKGANFHEWNNRINRLSYDFVVCGKDSTVIAAVELDDKTHESNDRASRDDKKNRASADAGLRLLRWHVRSLPSEEVIRQELLAAQSTAHGVGAPAAKVKSAV
jgi:hypothetical protein